MKKLLSLLAFITVILLISTSCSENSDQPSSPSPNSNSSALSKDNGTTTSANTQNGKHGVIGKLFDKHEADVLFGKVIGSVQISTDDLKKAVAKGKDYIFFTIKNNRLVVTNEKKESLTDDREELEKDEQMYFFSKSEVEKLLQTASVPAPITKGKKGGVSSATVAAASTITGEWRPGVLSLSTDTAVLESALACPPFCAN